MAEAIRPPRTVFQRMATKTQEVKTNIKNNVNTYFLLYFLIICISTFFIEKYFKELYEEYLFNILVQISFFGLFLKDLINLKLCTRNKIIIYTLLGYFLGNAFLPFLVTNKYYVTKFFQFFTFVFVFLAAYTIFYKEKK